MARKLKITENEKYTLQDMYYVEEYGEKWKIHTCQLQDLEYGKKPKIMENEKLPLDDLKNEEITEKREK